MESLAVTSTRCKRIVLALVLSSYLVVAIDGSLVITAISDIAADLRLTHVALSWVQNAYVLAFGGFMLAGGRLGDIYGRRHTFCISLILFCIGSLGAGLSPDAVCMIAARFVQGAGSAVMAPAALGLIVDYFEGKERVKAVAWYGSISGLGLCIGLVLGGAITSYASWRYGFLVNIPITVLMFAYAHKWLLAPKRSNREHLDFTGTALSASAAFALVYALDGAQHPLPWTVLGSLCIIALCVVEREASCPIIPAVLFHSRNRCNGYLSRLLLIGALMGYNFAISQLLQDVLHFTPLLTGCAFLPMTVTTFCGALCVPRLVGRHGNVRVLCVGLAMLAMGFLWLASFHKEDTYLVSICLPMLLIGFGQGLAMSPLTNLGIEGVDSGNTGAASGFVNVAHQLGGAFGMALMVMATDGTTDGTKCFHISMLVGLILVLSALVSTAISAASQQAPHCFSRQKGNDCCP